VAGLFTKIYNNVTEIEASKSKWFLEDSALEKIEQNIQARQKFARDYTFQREGQTERPCVLANIGFD
jgi:hypothetical protein